MPAGECRCCGDDDDCSYLDCDEYAAYCDNGDCICRTSCESNSDCGAGYCCRKVIDPSKDDCKSEGYDFKYGGISYLCDPPGWNVSEKAPSIFDLILNFFQNIF